MKSKDLHARLIERFGSVIDLRENPSILLDILEEIGVMPQAEGGVKTSASPPFGVSWMDSWVAHWVYNEKLNAAKRQDMELANVLQSLADLKFEERLAEIRRFIRDIARFEGEPPDGGPPEPGTPPAGPARFVAREAPPDGGPPPEPGVPLPPEPPGPVPPEPPGPVPPPQPVPPTGPYPARMGENPWILYWFISIKAPMLLDVIDAHITRRLDDMRVRGDTGRR